MTDFLPYKQEVRGSSPRPPTRNKALRENPHKSNLEFAPKTGQNSSDFGQPECRQHHGGRGKRGTVISASGLFLLHGEKDVVSISECDIERARRYSWHRHLNHSGKHYVWARVDGKATPLHRFIMNPPPGMVVDHIDGDPLNNRRENLRVCLPAENARNARIQANRQVEFKGVTLKRLKEAVRYVAKIKVNRKQIFLGQFREPEAAARAYDAAAIEHFGEFARPNFSNSVTQ